MLDGNKFWAVDAIIEKLRQALDLCQSILASETVGSLRRREISVDGSGQMQLMAQAHPRGLREDPDEPSKLRMSLEYTFRHRWFEYTTHLYNIQRLKRAQGLATRVEVPFVGYWALPDWDRRRALGRCCGASAPTGRRRD